MNVTEDCVAIAEAVSSLCGKTGRWANNYTVTHFVDIFKGSESKKVVEAGTIDASFSLFALDCFNAHLSI